jgi:hypothetical protein
MIDATEWLVCAFASQERAKVCTSGNPVHHPSFPRALYSHARGVLRGALGECGNPAFVLLDVPLRAY